MDLASIIHAVFPDIAAEPLNDGWAFALWSDRVSRGQDERFLEVLEWLVFSDAGSSRRFVDMSSKVLAPTDAWRASASFACSDNTETRQAITRISRDVLVASLQSPDGQSGSVAFTRSQAAAHARLTAMARAFFEGATIPCSVIPRLAPLLLGPTGSGKSSLLRRIAKENGATFIRTSVGEWSVIGARSGRPTIAGILEALAVAPVVLFVDELDKVALDGSGWTRSVMGELFSILDRCVPHEVFGHLKKDLLTPEEFNVRVEQRLFFCGAGTWQQLWSASVMGFGGSKNQKSDVVNRVAAERAVPVELLMRFSWPPLVLEYPGPDESVDLFRRTGIAALADLVGAKVNPREHDWSRGGMRSLESLAADLMLRLHEPRPEIEPVHATD